MAAIIHRAEAGQEVELTRRGKPVAMVISTRAMERLRDRRPSFGEAYRQFAAKYSLQEIGAGAGFANSVRDRSRGRDVTL